MCSGCAIETLQEALSELASDDLHTLPGPALCERALELDRLRQALDAEFTRTVGVLDRTRACETVRGGFLSGAAWLRHRCRLAPNAAAEQVRVARRLVQLPAVADAFSAGRSRPSSGTWSRSLARRTRSACAASPPSSATASTPTAPSPRSTGSTSAGGCG